ncbi:MAG: DUF2271 domain-containing protein [Panacagrimonas sp.]
MRLILRCRAPLSAALCSLFAAPTFAADLKLGVELPRLDVAEYHRPYLAAWIEREDRSVAANLAVWYQLKRGNAPAGPAGGAEGEGGTKWLPDLRQWWRRGGRELTVPADGITSATRAAGVHELSFSGGKAPLGDLPPGQYKLVVEAAREDGGRELVELPFQWPGSGAAVIKTQGSRELGELSLSIQP